MHFGFFSSRCAIDGPITLTIMTGMGELTKSSMFFREPHQNPILTGYSNAIGAEPSTKDNEKGRGRGNGPSGHSPWGEGLCVSL